MHRPVSDHPENQDRVVKAKKALALSGISFVEDSIESVDLDESTKLACRIHAREYVSYLLELSRGAPMIIDEDTYISRDSMKLALGTLYYSYKYAIGGRGQVFIISRPPGHHAGRRGRAMGASTLGFCLLNNAASAIEGFKDGGLKKIAVLDFDAHHGNGTMEIYYKERVLQIDFHQDPNSLSPHTGYPTDMGAGDGFGHKVNIILPPGSGDDLFNYVVEKSIVLINSYSPEALVVSAGFDGFYKDGLADLRLTENSYYKLGTLVRETRVPAVIVLEGGYSVGLRRGLISFVEGLLDLPIERSGGTKTPPKLFRATVKLVDKIIEKAFKRVGATRPHERS